MDNHTQPNRVKSELNSPTKPGEKLLGVVNKSHEILYKARTVFPFTIFPDTVIIDREKLTINKKLFFSSSEIMSIHINDILNVTANMGPIFGSIKVATRFFGANRPYKVMYFWRGDALKIKKIMQGYIIAIQKGLNCYSIERKDLVNMLEQLGEGA